RRVRGEVVVAGSARAGARDRSGSLPEGSGSGEERLPDLVGAQDSDEREGDAAGVTISSSGLTDSAAALPPRPPATPPTAAPTTAPIGPPTAPPMAAPAAPAPAAPAPTPIGCAPGLLVIGSRFSGSCAISPAPFLRLAMVASSAKGWCCRCAAQQACKPSPGLREDGMRRVCLFALVVLVACKGSEPRQES